MKNYFYNLQKTDSISPHLLLFPFAGGTSQSYRTLFSENQLRCHISSYELAGRGMRIQEPFCNDISIIKSECLESIKNYLEQPLVLFGHSMGAIVAFELLREIEQIFPEIKGILIVSAANSPKYTSLKYDYSNMSNEQFSKILQSMGGIPDLITTNPDLMKYFLPRIRNDFSIIQQYNNKDEIKLKSPIKVIAATDDENISRESILDWESYTQSTFQVSWCTGGHFYLEKNIELVSNIIKQCIVEVSHEYALY